MKKAYIPHPIDTTGIELPQELVTLGEHLAKNTHEVWAQQRLSDGWVYGDTLDAQAKTHPDLIPYEELPEAEKVYDRNTSTQTIKVILSLGYKLVKA